MTKPSKLKPGSTPAATPSAALAGPASSASISGLTQASLTLVHQAAELQQKLVRDVCQAFKNVSFLTDLPDPLALSLTAFNDLKRELEQVRDCQLEVQSAQTEILRLFGPYARSVYDALYKVELCGDGSVSLPQACLDKLKVLGVEIPCQVTPLALYNCLREFVPLQVQKIAARNQENLALEQLLANMDQHIHIGLVLVESAVTVMTQPSRPESLFPSDAQVSLHQHLMRIIGNPIGTVWPDCSGEPSKL